MTRPHKQTVDYFPHYCNSGKTLYILQNRYGNDGYAFWFKLLELLATTDGHYYDYQGPSHWQFLIARTGVTEVTATNIIATLDSLDAIDHELNVKKILWVQKLVDNLSSVYDRRKSGIPQRPSPETRNQPEIEPPEKPQPRPMPHVNR